jgi:hypothetical protein
VWGMAPSRYLPIQSSDCQLSFRKLNSMPAQKILCEILYAPEFYQHAGMLA